MSDDRTPPGSAPDLGPDRCAQALPAASRRRRSVRHHDKPRTCEGCDQPFLAQRSTQRHCRCSCRVKSFRKRRAC